MPIEVDTNNPLGLTVDSPGSYGNPVDAILYPGQTGHQISSLGYNFASFPDQLTGINAGIDWIKRHISSGATPTVGSLVSTLEGPGETGWQAFSQTTGITDPNTQTDPSQSGLYAAGLAAGEGTLQAFGGAAAFENAGYGYTSAPKASGSGGLLGNVEDFVVRFGLIIVGGVIILVALWQILSDNTGLPSPGHTATTVAKAVTA